MEGEGRNPFLFRGPIPTKMKDKELLKEFEVAIPSYSEVLFLHTIMGW